MVGVASGERRRGGGRGGVWGWVEPGGTRAERPREEEAEKAGPRTVDNAVVQLWRTAGGRP